MDGYVVNLADGVYDVLYGPGRVVEVLPLGKFRCTFTTRGSPITYSAGGTQARYPSRTLYWRNPVVVVPLKDDIGWNKIKPIVDAVIAAFRNAA